MKKRIFTLLIAALMIASVLPAAVFAADAIPQEIKIGHGAYDASTGTFSGGFLSIPSVGMEVPNASDLTLAVTKDPNGNAIGSGASKDSLKIASANWSTSNESFSWASGVTLTLEVESWTPFYSLGSGTVASPFVFDGSDRADVTVTVTKKTQSDSRYVPYTVSIRFNKIDVVYGEPGASLTVHGPAPYSLKKGDAFPVYAVNDLQYKYYYSTDTNWYRTDGPYWDYTKGDKVGSSETVEVDTAYLLEITFYLTDEDFYSEVALKNEFSEDGVYNCRLVDDEAGQTYDWFFEYGEGDQIDDKTLVTRFYWPGAPRMIEDVEVVGVTAPVSGEKPVNYGIGFAAPFDKLSVDSAVWSGDFAGDGSFKAGRNYTLDLTITGEDVYDVARLNELNASDPATGYTLASAAHGTVTDFRVTGSGLAMTIMYASDPEDLGTFTIDLSGGAIDLIPANQPAFDATVNALKAGNVIIESTFSASETDWDIDRDGWNDVVVLNGNNYQAHKDTKLTASYTLNVTKSAYAFIREQNALAYYSKIVVKFDDKEFVPGDVNGDGKINAKDVTMLMKYIVGTSVKPFVEAAADFDGNGSINAKDVTKLMKHIVGSGK